VSDDAELAESAADTAMEAAARYLASVIHESQPLAQLATDIARLAADTIPSTDEVSIALVDVGGTNVFTFSGALAATLDERQ